MDCGETWLLMLCGGTPHLLEQDNFDDLPFNQMGGLGRAFELFGDGLSGILEALNEGLAA